jgi:hypothetical protein
MIRIKKSLGIAFAALALGLVLTGSAQASGSQDWQSCGEQHWVRVNYFRVEAKAIPCEQAREVTAAFRQTVLHGTCEALNRCQVEGFDCQTFKTTERILCVKATARIRMRAGKGW